MGHHLVGYQGFDPSPFDMSVVIFYARSLVVLRQGRLHRCLEALALLGPILRVGRRPAGGWARNAGKN